MNGKCSQCKGKKIPCSHALDALQATGFYTALAQSSPAKAFSKYLIVLVFFLNFYFSNTVGLDDIRSFITLRRIEAQAELTLKSIKFEATTVFA